MLHLVQAEEGYVTPDGHRSSARTMLGLTTAEVAAVATFYTMYKRRPVGDYHVGVCTNTLCAVMGGDAIFAALKEHLGVGNDETTDDGTVTPRAHRVQRGLRLRARRDGQLGVLRQPDASSRREQLVDDLRAGEDVASTRGPRVRTFRRGRAGARRLPRRPRRRGPRPARVPRRPQLARERGDTRARGSRRPPNGPATPSRRPDVHADPRAVRALGRGRLRSRSRRYERHDGYQALRTALAPAP